ncbi:hypothetical protein ADUPG1_006477 [Aduncisulcus paluster]|uniref:Uncharacterized protein n=1 Tax=Aduncisulcus paluster TaxID=2918883 RepID=A0ABQ5KIE0_9EUKA|nr:hypothetical protein ADUPG1_006477 [Aduncisulcus paluster]
MDEYYDLVLGLFNSSRSDGSFHHLDVFFSNIFNSETLNLSNIYFNEFVVVKYIIPILKNEYFRNNVKTVTLPESFQTKSKYMPCASAYSYNGNRLCSTFPSVHHAPPLCLILDILIALCSIRAQKSREIIDLEHSKIELEEEYSDSYENEGDFGDIFSEKNYIGDLIDCAHVRDEFSFSKSGRVLGFSVDNYFGKQKDFEEFIEFLSSVKLSLVVSDIDMISGSPTIIPSKISDMSSKYKNKIPYGGASMIEFYSKHLAPIFYTFVCCNSSIENDVVCKRYGCPFSEQRGFRVKAGKIRKIQIKQHIQVPPDLDYHMLEAVYSSYVRDDRMVLNYIECFETEQRRRASIERRIFLQSYGIEHPGVSSSDLITSPKQISSKDGTYHFDLVSIPHPSFRVSLLEPNTTDIHTRHEQILTSANNMNPVTFLTILLEHAALSFPSCSTCSLDAQSSPAPHQVYNSLSMGDICPLLTFEITSAIQLLRTWYAVEMDRYESFVKSLNSQGISQDSNIFFQKHTSYKPFSFVSAYDLYYLLTLFDSTHNNPNLAQVEFYGYNWNNLNSQGISQDSNIFFQKHTSYKPFSFVSAYDLYYLLNLFDSTHNNPNLAQVEFYGYNWNKFLHIADDQVQVSYLDIKFPLSQIISYHSTIVEFIIPIFLSVLSKPLILGEFEHASSPMSIDFYLRCMVFEGIKLPLLGLDYSLTAQQSGLLSLVLQNSSSHLKKIRFTHVESLYPILRAFSRVFSEEGEDDSLHVHDDSDVFPSHPHGEQQHSISLKIVSCPISPVDLLCLAQWMQGQKGEDDSLHVHDDSDVFPSHPHGEQQHSISLKIVSCPISPVDLLCLAQWMQGQSGLIQPRSITFLYSYIVESGEDWTQDVEEWRETVVPDIVQKRHCIGSEIVRWDKNSMFHKYAVEHGMYPKEAYSLQKCIEIISSRPILCLSELQFIDFNFLTTECYSNFMTILGKIMQLCVNLKSFKFTDIRLVRSLSIVPKEFVHTFTPVLNKTLYSSIPAVSKLDLEDICMDNESFPIFSQWASERKDILEFLALKQIVAPNVCNIPKFVIDFLSNLYLDNAIFRTTGDLVPKKLSSPTRFVECYFSQVLDHFSYVIKNDSCYKARFDKVLSMMFPYLERFSFDSFRHPADLAVICKHIPTAQRLKSLEFYIANRFVAIRKEEEHEMLEIIALAIRHLGCLETLSLPVFCQVEKFREEFPFVNHINKICCYCL